MNPRARLLIWIGLVVAVIVIGALGYMLLEGQPLLMSLYMTIITVFTVGFREVIDLDQAGRVWTMIVILVGYAFVAIAVANIISLLVGGELRSIRGRLRMKSQIEQLKGHVIICGYGRMGTLIGDELRREGRAFVAVDTKPQSEMERTGTLFISGDATEDATLLEAGIMHARALVTCLNSDAGNVYVTLSARELRGDLTIISRADQPTTESKLLRAGADSVICPQTIGAGKAAALLLRPHVVDFVDMAARGVDMEIAQYEVSPDSSFVGIELRNSRIRERANVTIVAIKRADGAQLFNPGPDQTIKAGDQLILVGQGGLSERLSTLGDRSVTA